MLFGCVWKWDTPPKWQCLSRKWCYPRRKGVPLFQQTYRQITSCFFVLRTYLVYHYIIWWYFLSNFNNQILQLTWHLPFVCPGRGQAERQKHMLQGGGQKNVASCLVNPLVNSIVITRWLPVAPPKRWRLVTPDPSQIRPEEPLFKAFLLSHNELSKGWPGRVFRCILSRSPWLKPICLLEKSSVAWVNRPLWSADQQEW